MMFPVLKTQRLILRQLRQEDAADVYHYFSTDQVTAFYDLDRFTEVQQAEDLIQFWNNRFDSLQGIRWGITLRSEDRVIGTCGFFNWSKKHYRAEIGYELSPEYWSQGYMIEVLESAIDFGFKDLGFNRIQALIHPENVKSRGLLEKSGFTEEGLLNEYYFKKDRFVDAVIFSKLKKE